MTTPTQFSADVGVIGAGIVGLSLAWRLRQFGVPRVVVLESERPGFKSTGQSSGGIRAQFETRIEIELTQMARRVFFQPLFGDPGFDGRYQPNGYAFLAGNDELVRLRRAFELQRECGVAVEWVEQPALRDRFPYCDVAGVVGGTFSRDDGFVDPWSIVRWLEAACRRAGVEVMEHAAVTSIDVSDGSVGGVMTTGAVIRTDTVIIAAGAWSGAVARMAGASIPVSPSPRMKFLTAPNPAFSDAMPLVVDLPTGAYVRCVDGRPMVGVAPRQPRTSFESAPDPALVPEMIKRAAIRFPSLRGARAESFVSGLYEITPDGLPVAGSVPGVTGLYVAAGFNGHGVMHGPAVAYALAAELAGTASADLDLGPLAPGRFAGSPAHPLQPHLL